MDVSPNFRPLQRGAAASADRMLVVRLCTGHDEDHGLGDRYGVISEPFVVAAEQRDIDRSFHAVRPVVYQCPEQRAAQAVHGIVVDLEASRVLGVAGASA